MQNNTGGKLWNRNFTIITAGTVVSMLGNAISGFSIGLLVLDYTKSVFMYALFMVAYNLPKIFMPLIAGPYLDNFSRRRVIFVLDYCSSTIYLGIFLLISNGLFSTPLFLVLALLIGSIDSTYQVAYDSLYPMLVEKENYTKAYAISSMIYPLSTVMVPVAAFFYNKIGSVAPMFLFNAASFFIAATTEVFIRVDESQIKKHDVRFGLRAFADEFRDGIAYIRSEPGLMVVTVFFFVTMFAHAASDTLLLPYFKSTFVDDGLYWYIIIMGAAIGGRLVGGAVHYRFAIPPRRRFAVAIFVYAAITVLDGGYLFTPRIVMAFLMFISGFLSVNSYNIRLSATQTYVPNEFRARFNGAFQMLCNFGTIAGQLIAGALGDYVDNRFIVLAYMILNGVAVVTIMYRGREKVKPVYNIVPVPDKT